MDKITQATEFPNKVVAFVLLLKFRHIFNIERIDIWKDYLMHFKVRCIKVCGANEEIELFQLSTLSAFKCIFIINLSNYF